MTPPQKIDASLSWCAGWLVAFALANDKIAVKVINHYGNEVLKVFEI